MIAERALTKREGASSAAAERDPGAPASLEGVILAEPILLGGALHGAVVVELSAREADLAAIRSQLRLGFGWLDAHLHRGRAEGEKLGKERLEIVLGLLAAALEHERFQGSATALATELSTELGCDRVSVGFVRRGRVRVRALSHSAQFGERTTLIRSVEAAMDEAIDQLATVVFPVPEGVLPRASHAHAELARQFGAGCICTVPLVWSGAPCGALTLERSEPFDPRTVALVEVAAALAGPALEALRREDRFVGAKLTEAAAGVARDLVGPRHVALKLLVGGLAAIVVFFSIAKGDFRVTADTVLEPAVTRAAVAPFEGYVATAVVRAGDEVAEGQVLGSLDVRDLRLERSKWASQYDQSEKQYRAALAARDAAQAEIHAAAMAESRAELDRIEDRLTRADLRAPFAGMVVTGDLSQRLGAPVKRGEVLFEVAPLDAYRLYLKVGEADIAHVEAGQRGTLVLSSLPDRSFEFTIDQVTPVSVAEEGRNTFRVEARLHDAEAVLRPGVQGVAKIEAGRHRLIWIWTHDAIDWLRLELWSWSR
jgi:multidrug resistance efflux pump